MAYALRISDWSSDLCSADLLGLGDGPRVGWNFSVHNHNSIIYGYVSHYSHRVKRRYRFGRPLHASLSLAARSSRICSRAIWRPIASARRVSAASTAAVRSTGALSLAGARSEEHTSELQSLMRISYAVFCLKKKTT